MKTLLTLFLLTLTGFSFLLGQKGDTLSATPEYFENEFFITKRPSLGTDTFDVFMKAGGIQSKIAWHSRTVTLASLNNARVMRMQQTTQPVAEGAPPIILDAFMNLNGLQYLKSRYEHESDSSMIEFDPPMFTGWESADRGRKNLVLMQFNGFPFIEDLEAPWVPGMLKLEPGFSYTVPCFSGSDGVIYRTFKVDKYDKIDINGKWAECWRVDGGKDELSGAQRWYWYEQGSQRLVKTLTQDTEKGIEYTMYLRNR